MHESFLILGREPSLSLAELGQYLGDFKALTPSSDSQVIIIKGTEIRESAPVLLGGIVKSGIVLAILPRLTAPALAELLADKITIGQKFDFGLSLYDKEEGTKKLGLEVKKLLKAKGASVRLAVSRHSQLSAVDVVKNRLLGRGVELCIFKTDSGLTVGRTLAVQPYEEYSERDYGRPARDARSGMLPPKLARMMVNLALRQNHTATVLDPFCGSGTILQEALLMGHSAVGTDIEKTAISNSQKNLVWLAEHHPDLPVWRVAKSDVRQIDKILAPQSVDAIVTEFDLGPPLEGRESEVKINSIAMSLSAFYVDALRSLSAVLKPGRRAVLTWPYFKEFNVFISAFGELKKLGWELVEPYPKEYQVAFPLSTRSTLIYGRPDQHVWREILILKKTGD